MESRANSPTRSISRQWSSALTVANRYVLPMHPSWGETVLNEQETNLYFENIQEKGGSMYYKYKKNKLADVDAYVKAISNTLAEKNQDEVTLDLLGKTLSSAFSSDIDRVRAIYRWLVEFYFIHFVKIIGFVIIFRMMIAH
jgi:hypothetical protein